MHTFIRTVSAFVRAPIAAMKERIGEWAMDALDISRTDMLYTMEQRAEELAAEVDMDDLVTDAIDTRSIEEQLVDNYQFDDDAITEAVADRVASNISEEEITEAVAQSFCDSIDRRDVMEVVQDQVREQIEDSDVTDGVTAALIDVMLEDSALGSKLREALAKAMVEQMQKSASAVAPATEEGR